ncbi:cytochrome d ubiquinol oxidase subunit II [Actinacidiphila guanduensis]|uniref:Cytochrome bd-I ubiquinol oxidase subunit 2 apoprotein n=1 Tax=Actinacidiphila guanduensis TaxID=310781 RepID=A0A1H0N154_9ACTN|nr:cytochrome d ubiquinol oxidase subunit II [Actinacidiphila guanduensis]SDO86100.1 cytochrome bd-I ubiquinol oxidase subunit 2 apoprotein [Actinacidiphila guanduensis]
MTAAIAALMFAGVVCYAVLGGADFGAGLWDLTAGGAARGRAARHLIDISVGPVWEANHTWLIYCLVFLWSGFPTAFAAITTTLYFPLGLAVFGIVVRGSGFAFRKASLRTPEQRLYGVAFATSSVLTPYCFGAVAGGIASGRVPTGGNGNAVSSWNNPTSVLGGILAVVVCAYLAAVYLTAAAGADAAMRHYYRRRALVAAAVTGLVTLAGVFVLHSDAHRLFHQLSHRGLPALIVAGLCGLAGVALLLTDTVRGLRATAAAAVAAVVVGWGVAQYPYLLGTHLRLSEAVAPRPTLWVLVGVACAAAVLIVPSLVTLFRIFDRGGPEPEPGGH